MGCLCDALFEEEASENIKENPSKNIDQEVPPFHWHPEVEPVPPRDDGKATHLEGLKALGLDGLIDAHSHWFPHNVQRKIWSYFDRHYWPIAYRLPHAQLLEWVARNGVRRFTTLNYAHRPDMAEWLNGWTAEFAAEVPEAIPCGTFFPEKGVARYVRKCIEDYGFRGFKLHLRVSDMDPTHSLLAPAFEQLEQAGLPVVVHSGSGPDSGRFTSPKYMRVLFERNPHLKVVIAHMGSAEFEEYLTLAETLENVYLDTTMIFVGFAALGRFPANLLKRLEGISHKILFGSDFPNIPYPLTHAVEGVLRLPIDPQAKRDIIFGNAARLFGVAPI